MYLRAVPLFVVLLSLNPLETTSFAQDAQREATQEMLRSVLLDGERGRAVELTESELAARHDKHAQQEKERRAAIRLDLGQLKDQAEVISFGDTTIVNLKSGKGEKVTTHRLFLRDDRIVSVQIISPNRDTSYDAWRVNPFSLSSAPSLEKSGDIGNILNRATSDVLDKLDEAEKADRRTVETSELMTELAYRRGEDTGAWNDAIFANVGVRVSPTGALRPFEGDVQARYRERWRRNLDQMIRDAEAKLPNRPVNYTVQIRNFSELIQSAAELGEGNAIKFNADLPPSLGPGLIDGKQITALEKEPKRAPEKDQDKPKAEPR